MRHSAAGSQFLVVPKSSIFPTASSLSTVGQMAFFGFLVSGLFEIVGRNSAAEFLVYSRIRLE